MGRYAAVGRYAPVEERFWSKVDKAGPVPEHRPDLGPCWLWTGALSDAGYGSVRVNGTTANAHKWAWQQENGPVPDGLELDHLCRVRRCVRPSHMEPVTKAENIARGEAPSARLHREGRCSRGHALVGPDADVYVRKEGKPMCRRCRRERRRSRA